jgi:hypothetical protein
VYRVYRVYTGFGAARNVLQDALVTMTASVVTAASGAAVTITSATVYDDI